MKALDTPELKLQKYDDDLLWLMADRGLRRRDSSEPWDRPGWGQVVVPGHFHWYTPPGYGASATLRGATALAGNGGSAVTASVESMAKSVTSSVESFSSKVVGNTESFLGVRNSVNAPPPAARRSGGEGGHVFSAHCACACACAHCACACACAGGGHGCT